MHRLRLWCRPAVTVEDRPDWLFIKLHCHGMDPRDEAAMLGRPIQRFLSELTDDANVKCRYRVHFVTAREMVNIILTPFDCREGSPVDYRDYRLLLMRSFAASASRSPR